MVTMMLQIFEIIVTYQNIFSRITKILFLALFLLQKLCLCPAKLWSNVDFVPQNHGAMQTSPRKITEPLLFAPRNAGDIVLCPTKLWSKIIETQFKGHENILKLNFLFFLLIIYVVSEIFITHQTTLQGKNIFCHGTFK